MDPRLAARFPLIPRPKPPGRPLAERLEALRIHPAPPDTTHYDRVARASEVLNRAALIASDVGLSDLAKNLCERHYDIFAQASELGPDIATLTLQPVLNIPRQHIRDGRGELAYEMLLGLYRAAQQRSVAELGALRIDLFPVTQGEEQHRTICTQLWAAVISDGARALARAGRWVEAATAMTAQHGVGERLLDGRQVAVLSLLKQRRLTDARALLDASSTDTVWESAVAAILRAHCSAQPSERGCQATAEAVRQAYTMLADPSSATPVVFRARLGLAALDLAEHRTTEHAPVLQTALVDAARGDAYAAAEVLRHPLISALPFNMTQHLEQTVADAGLQRRCFEVEQGRAMKVCVAAAEAELRTLLVQRISAAPL